MDELYKAVAELLELISDYDVYLEQPPKKTPVPYLTYDIIIPSHTFDRYLGILTICVFYDGEHTLQLEEEVETIRAGIDKSSVVNASVGFDAHVDTIYPLPATEGVSGIDKREREITVSLNAYFA